MNLGSHPRLGALGNTPAEQSNVNAFASDLAAWFAGEPAQSLGSLAQVITQVAHNELAEPKRFCQHNPLLATEAAARATETLWPYLRDLLDDPPTLQHANVLPNVGSAAVQGVLDATEAVRQLSRCLPGVGWSLSAGLLRRVLTSDLPRFATLLGKLPQLRDLADTLGRLERASRNRGTETGGSQEVVGVNVGNNVARALPSEWALLADPSTEDLFYQRLVSHRLMSLELAGSGMDGRADPARRGPVIVCIDTSASMQGLPERLAKALVLALCKRVLPEQRVVHLMAFGGPDEQHELRIRSARAGLSELLDFLTLSFDGGTDFDGPLVRAMALVAEDELTHADVLVVTDGHALASQRVIDLVDQTRDQHGLKVYSVVLGRPWVHGVTPFSDLVWTLDTHEPELADELLRVFDGG